MVDHQSDVLAKSAEELRKTQAAAKKQAAKDVDDRAKVAAAGNKEAMRLQNESQPTPTQRENDLAKVGALDHDDKEPDGSEPEGHAIRRVMEARIPGNNPYETRAEDNKGKAKR